MKAKLLLSAVTLSFACMTQANAQYSAPIQKALDEAIQGGSYRTPTSSELTRAESLFLRLAKGAAIDQVAADADKLDLILEQHGSMVIVREKSTHKHGRGLFVFRRGARPDVLEAPHGFFDQLTREIGVGLFSEGSFSAAAWNTVHRSKGDMAHLSKTYFNAFTRATATAWPAGQTLQIHGFTQAKRKKGTPVDVNAIVSNGTKHPGARLSKQVDCLNGAFNGTVALYPVTSSELGGTTNAQGDLLRSMGYQNFIHMELSPSMRSSLYQNASARKKLLTCIQS